MEDARAELADETDVVNALIPEVGGVEVEPEPRVATDGVEGAPRRCDVEGDFRRMHLEREDGVGAVEGVEDRSEPARRNRGSPRSQYPPASGGRRRANARCDEPVNPFTTAGCAPAPAAPGLRSKKRRAACAVRISWSAARRRTPSGSPSPQTAAGRMALWRSSMRSQTAWPTR